MIIKERCFIVPDGDGGDIRICASKRPEGASLKALQDLFKAARRKLNDDITDNKEPRKA